MNPVGGYDISSWPHDLEADERFGSRQAYRAPSHPLSPQSRMSVFPGLVYFDVLQACVGEESFLTFSNSK